MKKIIITAALLLLVAYDLFSQCSDAGICTLQGRSHIETKRFTAGVSYLYGKSGKADDISYQTLRLDGSVILHDDLSVSFILPYNTQSGPLGTVSGIGDLIAAAHYTFLRSDDVSVGVQAGVKMSTGDANKNGTLPQMYQSGLGSTDLLFGLNGTVDFYSFTIGYQKAGERNNNAVTRLKRGDDLLIKAGVAVPADPFTINVSYLFIQRLSESSVSDSAVPGRFITLPGSDQTQLNIAGDIDVTISETITLRTGLAVPFLKRSINVDGLTRAVTLSLGLSTRW